MIRLTRLRQSDPLYVNPDHIERLHRLHETVVHLLNGNEYVVVESPEEIVEQITFLRARAIALAARMAMDGIDAGSMAEVRTAATVASVAPLPAIDEADAPAELGSTGSTDGAS
ncbi:MAG: flagellar FlbD family protein [Actinobacteria bacterium]|nr:flagellar FlbD family protein [Actinomycetota bacterium]